MPTNKINWVTIHIQVPPGQEAHFKALAKEARDLDKAQRIIAKHKAKAPK